MELGLAFITLCASVFFISFMAGVFVRRSSVVLAGFLTAVP